MYPLTLSSKVQVVSIVYRAHVCKVVGCFVYYAKSYRNRLLPIRPDSECVSHPNSKYRVLLPQSLTGFNAASITFPYKLSYTELKIQK